MPNIPVINMFENSSDNEEEALDANDNSYDYDDNLTAKLGGNYTKIIEFYDSRL